MMLNQRLGHVRDVDGDRKARLWELARERVRGLLAGPKVTALSPGAEKAPEPPAREAVAEAPQVSPAERGWDMQLLRSSIEEVLDGNDILVTSGASAAPLAHAARDMGEEVLAGVIERMPRLGCGSLRDFRRALSDGIAKPERLDWQFVTSHSVLQERGPLLRVRPDDDLDDIAAILNDHDEVVFTSEERLRSVLERARRERFESVEGLFADMLALGVLSIAGMKEQARLEHFPGLRNRSTAEFLVSLAPELGSAEDLMPVGRWQRGSGAANETPARPQRPQRAGYVYVMADPGTGGLLKVGQTTNHPQVRLHQLNKETSRVYPLELLEFWECDNPSAVERELHDALSHCRVTQSREFFATDIETVRRAVTRILG